MEGGGQWAEGEVEVEGEAEAEREAIIGQWVVIVRFYQGGLIFAPHHPPALKRPKYMPFFS